jgi:hypothetical protein
MTSAALLVLLAAPLLPEGNAYVRGLVAKQRAREEALNLYTYDVSELVEELDKKGRRESLEVTRYQVFHVKGVPIRKKVGEGGKPLPEDEAAREDERVTKKVESVLEGRTTLERAEVKLSQVLERYDFKAVGREEQDERKTLVFDFSPEPGERKLEGDRFLRVLAGRIWVDEEESQLVRAEIRSTEGVRFAWGLGPSLETLSLDLEFERAGEGVWLPSRLKALAAGRMLPLKDFRTRVTVLYSRYRRFGTDTEEHAQRPPP